VSGYLVDTCAISEFQRPSPDLGVVAWFARTELSTLHLSAITIGELRYGIALLKDRKKRSSLEHWLVSEVLPAFEGRVLPIDADGAARWGEVRARARLAGKTVSVLDGLLAATALHYNLSIVTRNEDDFAHAGVDIVNPWSQR
jgi:predicted nucleic acid-binding protein